MKSIKMKWLLILCAVFSLMHANAQDSAAVKGTVVDEVAWVVGDEAIFRSDIEKYIIDRRMRGAALPANPYCVYAEELAVQKLFLHQAELDSITISDDLLLAKVGRDFDEMVAKIGGIERLEAQFGKKAAQLKQLMVEQERTGALIEEVSREIYNKVKVTPADVRAFLRDTPTDSLPEMPATVEVQILIRKPEIAQDEIERVKTALRDYTDRVNAGTPFSTLAILYSEDPGTARRGGEVGLLMKGMLDPAYAAVASSLTDTKKVSKVVQSEYGYHIIQLIEKKGEQINTRHILLRPKVDEAAIAQDISKLDSLAEDIRRGKITFEQAVTSVSEDKDTYSNNGLMQNEYNQRSPHYRTARFEMDELPAEIAAVVDKMNVNEISAPFRMRDKNGNEVCAVVKLKNRVPGHRINISDDFRILQNLVTGQLQLEARLKWIEEKQKTTFVHISENWEQCSFIYKGWQFR